MEWTEIKSIVNDLPVGIAAAVEKSGQASPLTASLQFGRLLGVPVPETETSRITLLTGNSHFAALLDIAGPLHEGEDFEEILMEAVLPDDRKDVKAALLKAFSGKTFCDFRISGASDHSRWISMEGQPFENASGMRAAFFCFSDITARKQQEIASQQELNYMEKISDRNILTKGRYNLSGNSIISYRVISRMGMDIRSCSTYDDTLDLFLKRVDDENDRRRMTKQLDRKELIRLFEQGRPHSEISYRSADDSGNPIWIRKTVDAFRVPFSREIECYICTYDVTEMSIVGNIIAQMEKLRYDHFGLIDTKNGSYCSFRDGGKDGSVFSEPLAYDASIEKRVRSFIQLQDREETLRGLKLCSIQNELEKQDVCTKTVGYLNAEGRQCWRQLEYFYLDAHRDRIVILESNITERHLQEQKHAEQLREALNLQEKAMEAKSAFFSSMSHDLRTPLNGVIGFTKAAIAEKDQETRQRYLQRIESSASLLMDLVNDTLDLSRIESGKMVLKPEITAGKELVEEVVEAVRPAAELKKIRLSTNLDDYPVETVYIDSLKIKKVLLNLLSNAIKYTPQGGSVSLRILRLDPPENRFTRRIIVEDTGIGMSREFQEKLYEPFSQEHRPEAVNVSGTGLGLVIVKRIVDLMDGSIRVKSEIGKGTEFTVDLPVQQIEACSLPVKKAAPLPLEILRGKRILLCEDNYINTEVAQIQLSDAGMLVECAENGLEGIRKFVSSDPGYFSAILMDIRMPVMDGCEAARKIRSLPRPDAGTVPIIATTADAFEEDVRRCQEAGMNAHIEKPVETEKLLRTLCSLIPHREKGD
jgi:signal transduction histidine kinase